MFNTSRALDNVERGTLIVIQIQMFIIIYIYKYIIYIYIKFKLYSMTTYQTHREISVPAPIILCSVFTSDFVSRETYAQL